MSFGLAAITGYADERVHQIGPLSAGAFKTLASAWGKQAAGLAMSSRARRIARWS